MELLQLEFQRFLFITYVLCPLCLASATAKRTAEPAERERGVGRTIGRLKLQSLSSDRLLSLHTTREVEARTRFHLLRAQLEPHSAFERRGLSTSSLNLLPFARRSDR
jgi:hypothetical protein